jgi:hypothetical protein
MREVPVGRDSFALVDDEDYERVSGITWYLLRRKHLRYAIGSVAGKSVLMHRLLLKPKKSECIDHKDRNGLNNQRLNLRKCTHSQNMRNAVYPKRQGTKKPSQYKGVCWEGRYWVAQMSVDGRPRTLGKFKSEEAAARMYDAHAFRLSGEFALLNFPH